MSEEKMLTAKIACYFSDIFFTAQKQTFGLKEKKVDPFKALVLFSLFFHVNEAHL